MSKKLNCIAMMEKELQYVLDAHKIKGKVVCSLKGPRITRFCISLEKGVDVRKVERCSEEIKDSLGVDNVRILAPIPGEDFVGIEVPHGCGDIVDFQNLFEKDHWAKQMAIPLMLGEGGSGKKAVLDFAQAPHILMAGNDPEEISMGLRVMVMSLIRSFSPEYLHLVLFHPQEGVFAEYQKTRHLRIPVIHDTKRLIEELRETTVELERRYKILASAHAKTLREYNDDRKDQNSQKSSRLPYKILFIGELESLRKDKMWNATEMDICRIAQKGRAAGIHLVVATQYPESSVITGLIKANLPTRIAFRVNGVKESRLILDRSGAENLIGSGDMLLMQYGEPILRTQCATLLKN